MRNALYFMLKAWFVLEIFTFLSWFFRDFNWQNCIRHDSKPLKHLTTIHHFCSIRCSYGNTWEFCKPVTERRKRNENWICKRWRKKNIWNCKNYLFFSYILKLHVEVYLELPKNPPSQTPRTLVIHCVKSVQVRSFSWSVFSCTSPNTGNYGPEKAPYGHFSRIDFEIVPLPIRSNNKVHHMGISFISFILPVRLIF